MKKLILMMSSIITVSPILNSFSNMNLSTKISNIDKNINNIADKTKDNKKSFMSADKGMFLYDSTVKINQYDNNPFGSKKILDAQGNDETQYMDNVFLKSLQWDDTKKIVISSLANLKAKDKDDPASFIQDRADYELMENLSSKKDPKDTAIQEGMATLNRYVNVGIAKFNDIGYIPHRDTFFSELKNGTLKNSEKQDVITINKSSSITKIMDDSQMPSFSIRWYGTSMNLPEKFLTTPVTDFLNGEGNTMSYLYNVIKSSPSSSNNGLRFIPPISDFVEMFNESMIGIYDGTTVSYNLLSENFMVMCKRFWPNLDSEQLLDIRSAINDQGWVPESPGADVPEAFSQELAELDEETEEILTEAVEMTTAETFSYPIIDIIVQLLGIALIVGLTVGLNSLENNQFKTVSGKMTTLNNMLYDEKTGKINTINPALVNFKGEFSSTWTGENDGTIEPVYPSIVPEAIITPSTVSPILDKNYNVITGSNDDFNVIMDPTTWGQFTETALVDSGDDSVNKLLKEYNIFNANLYLDDEGWCDIVSQLKYIDLDPNSVAVMHVVNKKVVYCNIVDESGSTNLKYDTSAYLKESFIGTDLNHMDLIATHNQINSLVQTYNWAINCWEDQIVNGQKIQGIKNNPINNPRGYKTYQEWYYNTYVKDTVWNDKNLDEKTIETFIDKFVNIYNNGISNKTYVAMTNNNNEILDISSTILNF